MVIWRYNEKYTVDVAALRIFQRDPLPIPAYVIDLSDSGICMHSLWAVRFTAVVSEQMTSARRW